MPILWILPWLSMQVEGEAPARQALAEVLAHAADADEALLAPLARELRDLGAIDGLLLEVLVDGRAPAVENSAVDYSAVESGAAEERGGLPLSAFQERLALEVLCTSPARAAGAFLAEVQAHPEPVERVAVALRLLGRIGRRSDLAGVPGLLRAIGPGADPGRAEAALEHGLLDWLAREPELFEALPTLCGELSPELAAVVIGALARTHSPEAPRCLRRLLDLPEALHACILQALASTAELVPRAEVADLAEELLRHLDSGDDARAVAAANALGRLRARDGIPALIEHISDETPLARAALAALRAISGTRLPASPLVWRRWHADEEIWWRERAPELARALGNPGRDEPGRARLVAALGELSEHPLYRDELAPLAAAGLECRDPGVRVLTCAALERLGSRAALPFLRKHLGDTDENVVGHVQRALRTLAGIDLGRDVERWADHLRERGFALDDASAESRP